tara:strand:- start:104 stop:496 length:393 start_codon:yes stop_codon:yes gene_type:complete
MKGTNMKIIIQIYIFIIAFLIPISTYASEHNNEIENFIAQKPIMCVENGSLLMSYIHSKYGENVFALGVGNILDMRGVRGIVQIIYMLNIETKSFTILEFHPSGRACIISSGENFEFVDKPKPEVPGSKI